MPNGQNEPIVPEPVTPPGACMAHSGIAKDIAHLMNSDRDQWTEINAIKNRSIANLVTAVVTLIGVLGIFAKIAISG